MVKVKICGTTNTEDALNAAESGADFLGFIVDIPKSDDNLTKEQAKELIKKLPLEVIPVLVTYYDKAEKIIKLAEYIGVGVIQLHNEISLEEIGKIRKALPKIKLTKAIHVQSPEAIKKAKEYEKYVDYLLLDTKTKDRIGGTGKTHNWSISAKIVKQVKKPVFLAGGLNPENVTEAIAKVKPFGVDVNSGVKLKPRKKDYEKLKRFIENAKGE